MSLFFYICSISPKVSLQDDLLYLDFSISYKSQSDLFY